MGKESKLDTNKRTLFFDANCSPYLHGEVATFGAAEAAKLVARGIAHYVKKTDDGYVATDLNGKEIVHDDAEQDDTDGQGSGESEKEAEGSSTEGATERPKRVRASRAKTGRQTTRRRAKL